MDSGFQDPIFLHRTLDFQKNIGLSPLVVLVFPGDPTVCDELKQAFGWAKRWIGVGQGNLKAFEGWGYMNEKRSDNYICGASFFSQGKNWGVISVFFWGFRIFWGWNQSEVPHVARKKKWVDSWIHKQNPPQMIGTWEVSFPYDFGDTVCQYGPWLATVEWVGWQNLVPKFCLRVGYHSALAVRFIPDIWDISFICNCVMLQGCLAS